MGKRNNNNTLVSVIIPAYNAENFLSASIESIAHQTYDNLEIIIINDASTDDTSAVINQWASKDPRIKSYDNEVNLGIGATRTKGIELSTGRYVCWQDADDISLPSRVELQTKYLDEHANVGVVGGFMQFFDEKSDGQVRRYEETDDALRKTIFRYNPVAQPASMVRRECYERVGLYDQRYTVSEDLEMLLRIGTAYEFANVQQVILRYRQSSTSLTRANLKKMEQATLALRLKYAKNPAYNFTLFDAFFNGLQYLTLWFMPTAFRMFLFRIIRGDK
jgi:glycosyltransferase involved in cell wall biosynthesis